MVSVEAFERTHDAAASTSPWCGRAEDDAKAVGSLAARRLESTPMLEMRQECERCHAPLPADSGDARICSYECTFCATCTTDELGDTCPNCGGELVKRPTRKAG